jgi:hypothetical protein
MSAFAGVTPAYVQGGVGKPFPSMASLSFSWDGAATPTLTVKDAGSGLVDVTYSGQALIQSGVPQSVLSAASGGNPWEVGPA